MQKPRSTLTFFFLPCSSQALPFSHLILATGSTGLFPGKFNQVSSQQMAIQAYEDMVTQVSCPLPGAGIEDRAGGGALESETAVGHLGRQQGAPRRCLGLQEHCRDAELPERGSWGKTFGPVLKFGHGHLDLLV